VTCRDWSYFFDVGDVLVDRQRIDQIFLSEASIDEPAFEMSLCAIALDAARGAGETGIEVSLQGLLDRESEIAVGACRD